MTTDFHVLIIDNSLRLTGAFKSIYSVAKCIPHVRFTIALPAKSKVLDFVDKERVSVINVDFQEISKSISILLYLPKLFFNSLKLVRYIKRENVSIVHVNDIYNMSGVVIKLIYPHIRLVYHVRLMPDGYIRSMYNLFVRIVSNSADTLVSVSEAVASELKQRGVESIVIYDAIPEYEKYPIKVVDHIKSTITLLYLANFTPGKGHNFAIEAFARAIAHMSSLKMIMVGGDLGLKKNIRYKVELMEQVKYLNLQDAISFSAFESDVEALIKRVDIVLNFSESESFSLTCLEALWYGTPLIATDCGGPKELFEHEKSGLLVPVKDVERMSSAIVKLASDKQLQSSFSYAGKIYVRSKFNREKIAQALEDLYRTLILVPKVTVCFIFLLSI